MKLPCYTFAILPTGLLLISAMTGCRVAGFSNEEDCQNPERTSRVVRVSKNSDSEFVSLGCISHRLDSPVFCRHGGVLTFEFLVFNDGESPVFLRGASGFVRGFFIERTVDPCSGRRNGRGCPS